MENDPLASISLRVKTADNYNNSYQSTDSYAIGVSRETCPPGS